MAIEGETDASRIAITKGEAVIIVPATCSSATAGSILVATDSVDIAISVVNSLLVIGWTGVAGLRDDRCE